MEELTKKAIRAFLKWTSSRANVMNKNDAVDYVYDQLKNGIDTFTVSCGLYAQDSGGIGTYSGQFYRHKKNSFRGDDYTVNCKELTIKAKNQSKEIRFKEPDGKKLIVQELLEWRHFNQCQEGFMYPFAHPPTKEECELKESQRVENLSTPIIEQKLAELPKGVLGSLVERIVLEGELIQREKDNQS